MGSFRFWRSFEGLDGGVQVSVVLIIVNNEPCKAYLFIYDQIFSQKAIYDINSTLNSKTDTRVPYFYQLCYWQHFKCPPLLKSYFTLLHANVFASQTPTFPTIKPIKIYTFRTLRSRSYEKPRQTVLESSRETYNCFYNALINSYRVCWRVLRGASIWDHRHRSFTTRRRFIGW